MKISWLLLTYNRPNTVKRSIEHNKQSANYPINELIHCDNGSEVGFNIQLQPDVSILNRINLGVASGYNSCMAHATGTHILITGCDRIMPISWLRTIVEHYEAIPNTGIISIYSQPIEKLPERLRGNKEGITINGKNIIETMPMGAKFLSRELQREIGYLKEDLGLYGWEDVLWGERAEKVTKSKGLINYIIKDFYAEHLGDEGILPWKGEDDKSYHAFKQREATNPKKQEICRKYREAGYPYYSPY
jgi:GT2 family glycosyltransferase